MLPRYPYLKKENKNTLMLRFPFNIRARVPNFPLCTCSPWLFSLHGLFQTLKLQCFASVLPQGNPGLQFNVPRYLRKMQVFSATEKFGAPPLRNLRIFKILLRFKKKKTPLTLYKTTDRTPIFTARYLRLQLLELRCTLFWFLSGVLICPRTDLPKFQLFS